MIEGIRWNRRWIEQIRHPGIPPRKEPFRILQIKVDGKWQDIPVEDEEENPDNFKHDPDHYPSCIQKK